jgi:hypothetical protein
MQLGAAASPHRQPSLLRTPPLASIEQPVRDREIPIALAAPACPITRAFLPWRLSDAGPGACLTVAMGRHPKPFTKRGACHMITELSPNLGDGLIGQAAATLG